MPLNKFQPTMSIFDAPHGAVRVRHPVNNQGLWKQIKELAGARWMAKTKEWYIADDYVETLQSFAQEHELALRDKRENGESREQKLANRQLSSRLYSFQREAIQKGWPQEAFLYSFETGLGKTVVAVEFLRHYYKPGMLVLITCPANVRDGVWEDELHKWWPGCPEIAVIGSGKEVEKLGTAPINICSYALLPKAVKEQNLTYDVAIFDEAHNLQSSKAKRSSAAMHVAVRAERRIALTATPMTTEPWNVWYQLHVLQPHRWGTYWEFVRRYASTIENQWGGLDITGLREDTLEELKQRLDRISCRVTKKEVKHLLPPFTVQMARVKADKDSMRELTEKFDGADMHRKVLDSFTLRAGKAKTAVALREVSEAQKTVSHIMVLTYYKATAKALAEELHAVHVDGSVPTKERNKRLKHAAKAEQAIVVATMDSVKEGIDLTAFTHSICVELYRRPATIVQLLGRFNRLSSGEPGFFKFLVLKGTLDEVIANTLERRLNDISKLVEEGIAEEKLSEAFGSKGLTDEEFLKELRKAAAERDGFDEYV